MGDTPKPKWIAYAAIEIEFARSLNLDKEEFTDYVAKAILRHAIEYETRPDILIKRAYGALIKQGGDVALGASVLLEDASRILSGRLNPDGSRPED